MMKALTGDTRFTEQADTLLKREQSEGKLMMCEYINALEARGERKGELKGETKLASLLEKLYSLGRDEDAKLAVLDTKTRTRLYEELCIVDFSHAE